MLRGRRARPGPHPVVITIDGEHPGPVIPADFAGLGFERGPLNPGNAGVAGYLFRPGNESLVTLFRQLGLRSLRIGGGSVENMVPAGTGRDGFTGIDNLFGFAAAAGVKVIYSLRLLNPAARPVDGLKQVNAQVAGYIWRHYRDRVASFSPGERAGLACLPRPSGPPVRPGHRGGGPRGAGQRIPVLPGHLAELWPTPSGRPLPGPCWPGRTRGPTPR